MKQLLSFLMLLVGITAAAQEFTYTYEGETLNYSATSRSPSGNTCAVAENRYLDWDSYLERAVVIPEKVLYDNSEYSVTEIGYQAFMKNWNITSIDIPNSVTYIGICAFEECVSLTSIDIPNSVTEIGECAFINCCGLTSVNIPNSVTEIRHGVFAGCESLTSVVIPNSVTSIGEGAFFACSNLTSIDIPNSVKHIGENAFSRCSSLTSVVIPNSVTSIGDYAFSSCSSLTSIYSLNPIPPTVKHDYSPGMNCFESTCYQNATLYVPQEALEAYRTAEMWEKFKNIVGINPTKVTDVNAADYNMDRVYYDMNGRRLNNPIKGLNIVNGKKVMIK